MPPKAKTISPIELSICVPTTGRKTLPATLESIARQLGPDDSVTVMPDLGNTEHQALASVITTFQRYADDPRWSYDAMFYPAKSWGHCQRNRHIRMTPPGKWICSIDDDDEYTENALELFRHYARVITAHESPLPLVFRMRMPEGHLIWKDGYRGLLLLGNYGTPCFLVPRLRGKLSANPVYGLEYAGDHSYIWSASRLIGAPQFIDEVVANIKPKGRPNG